mmetsp:Transcript_7276/g.16623  ORF Transcript_7276/g.16623 Transcript_7276/m.16623 type:complete len:205 (-) Transcript_7276:7255-7869(-)
MRDCQTRHSRSSGKRSKQSHVGLRPREEGVDRHGEEARCGGVGRPLVHLPPPRRHVQRAEEIARHGADDTVRLVALGHGRQHHWLSVVRGAGSVASKGNHRAIVHTDAHGGGCRGHTLHGVRLLAHQEVERVQPWGQRASGDAQHRVVPVEVAVNVVEAHGGFATARFGDGGARPAENEVRLRKAIWVDRVDSEEDQRGRVANV